MCTKILQTAHHAKQAKVCKEIFICRISKKDHRKTWDPKLAGFSVSEFVQDYWFENMKMSAEDLYAGNRASRGVERRAASRWRYFLYTGNAALNSCRLHPCGLVPLNWSCLSWEFEGQFYPSLTFWHISIAFWTQGQISSIPLDGCIKRLHLSYAYEKTLWAFSQLWMDIVFTSARQPASGEFHSKYRHN